MEAMTNLKVSCIHWHNIILVEEQKENMENEQKESKLSCPYYYVDYFDTVYYDVDRDKLHWQNPCPVENISKINLKNYILIPVQQGK